MLIALTLNGRTVGVINSDSRIKDSEDDLHTRIRLRFKKTPHLIIQNRKRFKDIVTPVD